MVENAVQSILGQSFRNFEIIVVDDCTTVDTEAVMREMRDTRIVHFNENLFVNEDVELLSRLAVRYGIFLIDKVTVLYHWHDTNTCQLHPDTITQKIKAMKSLFSDSRVAATVDPCFRGDVLKRLRHWQIGVSYKHHAPPSLRFTCTAVPAEVSGMQRKPRENHPAGFSNTDFARTDSTYSTCGKSSERRILLSEYIISV